MPRVPNYQPGQVAPVQTTNARLRAVDAPNGMQMIGKALEGAGKLVDLQDKFNDENDQTQARLMSAQVGTDISKALSEYKLTKAGTAREGQAGFTKQIEEIRTKALEGAANPRQRRYAEDRISGVFASAQEQAFSHAIGEAKVERSMSFDATAASWGQQALATDDPAERDKLIASGIAARRQKLIEIEGLDPEAMPEAFKLDALDYSSKVHGQVVDRMFAVPDPDIDGVGRYLDAYGDEMQPSLVTDIMKRMQGPLQDRTDDYRADLITVPPIAGNAPASAAGPWQSVAVSVANRFGLDPSDVAAVMSYETGGTFSPTIMGGKGGQYMGLIQFGPAERKKYGIDKASTPEQWTKAVGDFLQDRGFKRGMGVLDLYSTINAGTPGRYNASDGNGTVRSHVEQILGAHKEKAKGWLGGAAGYSNAPREWDKAAVYKAIEDKAASEGWSPEATKRVKSVWDRRMASDEGLLGEQRRQADDEAKVIALKAGDDFKVSMLPKSVRDNLSPVDLAGYEDAERRVREARVKAANEATAKSTEWALEAMQRFEPEKFKREDLKKYIGVLPGETLNGLFMKQTEMVRKGGGSYSDVNYRGQINSEIEFQTKHNGIKLNDEQKVQMFDYMSGMLGQLYAKKGGALTKQDVSTIFSSGMRQIPNGGGWFGQSSKPVFEVLSDVPADFRDRFMKAWKGNRPPTEGDVVSAYQQVKAGR